MKFRLLVVVIGLLILAGGFTGLVDDAQAYLVAIAPPIPPPPWMTPPDLFLYWSRSLR